MKRVLLVLGLLGLLALAGCTGGVVTDTALNESATYDWDTEATGTIDVGTDSYKAVYVLDNTSEIELFHRGELGGDEPLPIRAIKFQYPNGTVVNASAMNVTETDSRTVISFPQSDGRFAYSARSRTGEVSIPVGMEGSYEVILPPGARIRVPIISSVRPGGYDQTLQDDRVHLQWDRVDSDVITVSYYLQRDLYLFSGLLGLLALISLAGLMYFRRQLSQLAHRRETREPDDIE